MKKFEFKSKVEPIEICGKEYVIDTGNFDMLTKVFEKYDEVIDGFESIKGDMSKEKVETVVKALGTMIDSIFGDGEFERIFNSKECNRNINYMAQVCVFVVDQLNSQSGQ